MKLISGVENVKLNHKDFPCLNGKCFYSCFSYVTGGLLYNGCVYELDCPYCGSKFKYDVDKNMIVDFKAELRQLGPIWGRNA